MPASQKGDSGIGKPGEGGHGKSIREIEATIQLVN